MRCSINKFIKISHHTQMMRPQLSSHHAPNSKLLFPYSNFLSGSMVSWPTSVHWLVNLSNISCTRCCFILCFGIILFVIFSVLLGLISCTACFTIILSHASPRKCYSKFNILLLSHTCLQTSHVWGEVCVVSRCCRVMIYMMASMGAMFSRSTLFSHFTPKVK